MKKYFKPFWLFILYLTNRIVTYIPICFIREIWLLCLGMKKGKGTQIDMGQYMLAPFKLRVGHYCHINQGCILDARGGITIGDNVSISHRVVLMTGSHNINTHNFEYKCAPIIIHNNVFVGVNVTILQNVTIEKGAVICAGAVVTKNVPEYAVVAGIPAKIIGYRDKNFDYKCNPDSWFS